MKNLLLAAGCALITSCAAVGEPSPSRNIRVMTYNIHHGEGSDAKIDLPRIAELIRREKADIVALQEIDRGVERSARRDLISELAELTGMKFYFGKNIIYQGGDYGNAVLTRFPVLQETNTHFKMLRPGEQRGVQQLLLNVNGTKLAFMNTHIDYRPDDEERKSNVIELAGLIKTWKSFPVILCGDFNCTPDSEVYAQLKKFMNDAWTHAGKGNGFTFSSTEPDRRIDYIWFAPTDSLKPGKVWIPPSQASDHLPVVCEFLLK